MNDPYGNLDANLLAPTDDHLLPDVQDPAAYLWLRPVEIIRPSEAYL
jgi:hypothetical protein